jgi:RNA polymerase I-specific transcription initiation factor RRN7
LGILSKDLEPADSIVYRGSQALELYLQSYQLVLWKQCYALIHTIGLPTELESVVKDLWALRLQLFREKISEPDSSVVFSSQPETETESENQDDTKARQWKVQVKGMPTLIHSLGICYLGAILLRLPVSLGDFHRY